MTIVQTVAIRDHVQRELRDMLFRSRVAYECHGYGNLLHGPAADYSDMDRDAIHAMHRLAYEYWDVPDLSVLPTTVVDISIHWNRDWGALVSPYLTSNKTLSMSAIAMDDDAVGCGFKNMSVITRLQHGQGTMHAFIKIGESATDSSFHQHSASLRHIIGLTSVPVAVTQVDGLLSDQRSLIEAMMNRGQSKRVAHKRKRGE